MAKKRRFKAATVLNNAGKYKTSGTAQEASEAAKALGRRRAQKYGKKGMSEIGKLGAAAYWGAFTPEERRIEVKRRAMVRKRNRRARMAKMLEDRTVE